MRVNFDISNLEAALALIDERCNASEAVAQARDGVVGKLVAAKSDPDNKCLPYEVRYGSKCFFNHEAKAKWEREQLLRRNPDWRLPDQNQVPISSMHRLKGISTKAVGLVSLIQLKTVKVLH